MPKKENLKPNLAAINVFQQVCANKMKPERQVSNNKIKTSSLTCEN
jgi:hypothetical protein